MRDCVNRDECLRLGECLQLHDVFLEKRFLICLKLQIESENHFLKNKHTTVGASTIEPNKIDLQNMFLDQPKNYWANILSSSCTNF
jgi:hypothetical protein